MAHKPKILLFDIEITPSLGYTWGKYQQDVIEFNKDWYFLCFAYKWLGSQQVRACSLPDFPLYKKDKENDYELIKKLWELFDKAEIICGHNCDEFDIKKANARFAVHGLKPPTPFKSIDTLKIAKRHFQFTSNKLGDLAKHFGLGQKLNTGGFELWRGCMIGDKKSWKKMVEYNKQDVVLLEKLYRLFQPWAVAHPNLNIYGEKNDCPGCGSPRMWRRGFDVTRVSKCQKYQCQDCGRWSYGKRIRTNVKIR